MRGQGTPDCERLLSFFFFSFKYAISRFLNDSLEIQIKDHLGAKYGREFVLKASENRDFVVNERVSFLISL